MINLRFGLTIDEYKDFTYYTGWQSPDRKRYRIKYYGKALIFYLVGIIVLFSMTPNFHLDATVVVIVTVMMLLLIIYVQYRVKAHYFNFVKKMIDESGEEKILPVMDLSFIELGVNAKTNEEEVKYSWNAIMKKLEVNNCYYLYLNSRQALIVPQRVFANKNEKEAFDKFLAEHLPLQAVLPTP